MLNSPHAYNQNKAFTKHIVEAMMQSFEEKHELEVSIPRKLYNEWEPTIKIKIKYYECHALCDLGASVSTIQKTLCDMLGFREFDECLCQVRPLGWLTVIVDLILLKNRNFCAQSQNCLNSLERVKTMNFLQKIDT